MKKILNQDHKGIGGLYFIMTNIICAMIMVIALQLSWDSQAVAMADNLAYITSINTTVHSYIGNVPSFNRTNPTITTRNGGSYSPLNDFNKMLRDSGISRTGASICTVRWTGSKTYIQIGEFETSLGTKVRPHQQESTVENY